MIQTEYTAYSSSIWWILSFSTSYYKIFLGGQTTQWLAFQQPSFLYCKKTTKYLCCHFDFFLLQEVLCQSNVQSKKNRNFIWIIDLFFFFFFNTEKCRPNAERHVASMAVKGLRRPETCSDRGLCICVCVCLCDKQTIISPSVLCYDDQCRARATWAPSNKILLRSYISY